MEKITVWGYLKEYEETKEELLKAVTEVFESGTLILGQKVRDFEQAYSDYIGVKYGVGCDNGTNAITLALKALEIGEGDGVSSMSIVISSCVHSVWWQSTSTSHQQAPDTGLSYSPSTPY